MTTEKFNLYTDHVWKMREYLCFCEAFDYPWYGGLKSKFVGSAEACDAMQDIWIPFINNDYKTKKQFKAAYKKELKRLGEDINSK